MLVWGLQQGPWSLQNCKLKCAHKKYTHFLIILNVFDNLDFITYFLYFVLFFHLRPPVVKIDRAISMLDLRQLLPKAVFETCFSREGVLLENIKKISALLRRSYIFKEYLKNTFRFVEHFNGELFFFFMSFSLSGWFILQSVWAGFFWGGRHQLTLSTSAGDQGKRSCEFLFIINLSEIAGLIQSFQEMSTHHKSIPFILIWNTVTKQTIIFLQL